MNKFPTIKQASDNPITSEIKSKQEQLKQDNFTHVDMHLSVLDQESLNRIRVEREIDPFDSYGPVRDELKAQLAQHLSGMGQNDSADIERVATIIYRLASGMQKGFAKEAVWITVRVSLPNPAFDVPRWLPDGAYFTTGKKTYKLVTALKGAPTLFGKVLNEEAHQQLEEAERENQRKNENNPEALEAEEMRIRRELAKIIEPMHAADPRQATTYLVGDENAVIHSEPSIREPRIFVSVLPGSQEQIEEWRTGAE